MNTTDLLGYSGCTLLVLLFIPQVYKTTISGSAKDLSMFFLVINMLCCCLMIPYAALLDLKPVLISNSVLLVLTSYLIIFKCKTEYYNNAISQSTENN